MTATIEPFYLEFGRKIQDLRAKRGITQGELGRRLTPSVTRASIANIESGKQRVYTHALIDIAHALDVSILELLGLDDGSGAKQKRPQKTAATEPFEDELASKLSLTADEIHELALRIGSAQQEPLTPDVFGEEEWP